MGCGRAGKCGLKMNLIGGEWLAAIFQIRPALNLLKTSGNSRSELFVAMGWNRQWDRLGQKPRDAAVWRLLRR
jgi:hypothetical protein